jgi:hypothetical protein
MTRMPKKVRSYGYVGLIVFFAAIAVFLVYHISHGFPGPDIMIRLHR